MTSGLCACTITRKASRALLRVYDSAFASTDVTVTEFALLRALERVGAIQLSRLAELMVLERTSLYRMIGPLADRGLVSIADGRTRTGRLADLTELGRQRLVELTPVWEGVQRGVVERLGSERWKEVAQFLQDVPGLVDDLR